MTTNACLTLTLGLCLAVTQMAYSDHAQGDIKCPGKFGHNHEAILEYAALAELAYEKPSSQPTTINIFRHCAVSQKQLDSTGERSVMIRSLPDHVVNEAKKALLTTYDKDNKDAAIYLYQTDNRVFYACDRDRTLGQRLAIAFSWIEVGRKVGLGYKFGLVSGVAGFALTGTEEIEAIELHQRNRNGSAVGNELILGIQGTDPTRLRQWVSSIQNMVGDSCIFDFAVEVTRSFFRPGQDVNFRDGAVALVGHSLGGAVVQYSAEVTHSLNSLRRRKNLPELQAYSYNSFGMPQASLKGEPHHYVNSIVIAGEVLERIVTETRQVGHVYRYDTGGWRVIKWFQQLDRHSIKTVQRKICECIDPTGLKYEYGAPPIPRLQRCT